MLDIGFGEIALIVIVVLIFFGPKSIPEVASTLSKGMSKLKDAQSGLQNQINEIKREMNESIKLEEEKKRNDATKAQEELFDKKDLKEKKKEDQ